MFERIILKRYILFIMGMIVIGVRADTCFAAVGSSFHQDQNGQREQGNIFRLLRLRRLGAIQDVQCRTKIEKLLKPKFDFSENTNVTDKEVLDLLDQEAHYRIVYLNFSGCSGITDESLEAVARRGQDLEKVKFYNCINITDAGVMALFKECRDLVEVHFSLCRNLSDASVEMLAQYCSLLKKIDLYGCKITDVSLRVLAEGCPELEKVILDGCNGITAAGLIDLAAGCPKLRSLSLLFGCNKISPMEVDFLRRNYPGLTISILE